MKRAVLLVALALAPSGCGFGSDPLPESEQPNRAGWYALPDGREVLCIYEAHGYGAGFSCDWDNARHRR